VTTGVQDKIPATRPKCEAREPPIPEGVQAEASHTVLLREPGRQKTSHIAELSTSTRVQRVRFGLDAEATSLRFGARQTGARAWRSSRPNAPHETPEFQQSRQWFPSDPPLLL
jgi:hypothetical protein